MQIPVTEVTENTRIYAVTTGNIEFASDGIVASRKAVKFTLVTDAPRSTEWAINFDKLSRNQKINILNEWRDASGAWLSTRAHSKAQELGIA